MKSQKLSIYLIKEDITNHDDIVKDRSNKVELDNGVLYYKKSFLKQPTWTGNFFNKNIDELNTSSASGLYIASIDVEGKEVLFVLSFGHGWQMLKDGVIVEQFGIKTALSIIKDEVKKIEKKNFRNGLKDVSEQLGNLGSVADFGFDVEQDIMRAIVGEPIDKKLYGTHVVGKNALSLSIKKDVNNIERTLKSLYKAYVSDDHKKKFEWFDNFSSVSDKKLIRILDKKIIEKINDETKTDVVFWLAIPEVISWENTKCFKYSKGRKADEYQDIIFDDFRNSLKDDVHIDVDVIKSKKVFHFDVNDHIINSWSIYKCLYAEVDLNEEKYLFVSGKYYKVDKDYKKKVEDEFLVDESLTLPDWIESQYEHIYNSGVASGDTTYQCLDGGVSQKNLIGKGKIEFADLVRSDNYLFHVKKYGSSSVLSHLFSQGLVSATLLLTDKSFREEVNTKLIASHKNVVTDAQPSPEDYTIVYAIGTTKDELRLPFFSLVNYRNIKAQLELYRFKVLMVKINQV